MVTEPPRDGSLARCLGGIPFHPRNARANELASSYAPFLVFEPRLLQSSFFKTLATNDRDNRAAYSGSSRGTGGYLSRMAPVANHYEVRITQPPL